MTPIDVLTMWGGVTTENHCCCSDDDIIGNDIEHRRLQFQSFVWKQ